MALGWVLLCPHEGVHLTKASWTESAVMTLRSLFTAIVRLRPNIDLGSAAPYNDVALGLRGLDLRHCHHQLICTHERSLIVGARKVDECSLLQTSLLADKPFSFLLVRIADSEPINQNFIMSQDIGKLAKWRMVRVRYTQNLQMKAFGMFHFNHLEHSRTRGFEVCSS